jgi:hypothetical protein
MKSCPCSFGKSSDLTGTESKRRNAPAASRHLQGKRAIVFLVDVVIEAFSVSSHISLLDIHGKEDETSIGFERREIWLGL